jgi:transcriptional regulator with XRE-family HTH domain
MDWLQHLGELLHQARRRQDRTIEDVAKATNISPAIISLVERGKRPRVSFEVMGKLARELGVSIDKALDDLEKPEAELEAAGLAMVVA